MLTMRPKLRVRMAGKTSRLVWNAADRFTARARSQSEALLRRLDECRDLAGVGEVGAVMQRPHAAAVLELPPLAFDLPGIAEAVQHDIAAFGGEALRHRVAQTLGRAGDQRASAFQHVVSSAALALDDLEADVDPDFFARRAV